MDPPDEIVFGPFRLELSENRLRRGRKTLELQRRPLALLRYLATNPGRVVGKDELLRAVWAGTVVSKTTLKVCVRTVREALGEDADRPRYIETVGRQGYRFIGLPAGAPVASAGPPGGPGRRVGGDLVGRGPEMERLRERMKEAREGTRRVVFVTGEAGIGKTALVERFLERVRSEELVHVAKGQCLEQYGEGEAYLPVLEAASHLCREPGGELALRLLHRYAPSWLLQLPAFLSDSDREALQRQVGTATRERMLREMADAVEAFAAERTLVLVLEDLHWSDVSTLELLSYVAQRREPARLLLIGTYRPTDVIVREHPLRGIKQELRARGRCEELALELLTPATVAEYVGHRLGESPLSAEVARAVHRHTQGNSLFMVEMLDHLIDRGLLAEHEGRWRLAAAIEDMGRLVPDNLRQLIERQLERLPPDDRRLLEAASVAGAEFAVAALAAATKRGIEEVEESCEALASQGSFLREAGLAEWPDGTVSGAYRFAHVLYRNVLYERVAEARRVRLHRAIGEREESAYGGRCAEIAGGLAEHFERGREFARAARHRLAAADNAVRRCAYEEATRHFTAGIALLEHLPETPQRAQEELLLCFRLGASLSFTKGFAAPEVERAFVRARDLCRQLGDSNETLIVLPSLRAFHFTRGDLANAQEFARPLLDVAERVQDPFLLLWAHFGLGENLLYAGRLKSAREHLEQALVYADPRPFRSSGAFRGVQDPGIAARASLVLALYLLGFPDQAGREEAAALAEAERSDPASIVFAQTLAALHRLLRRESSLALAHADRAVGVATEHGFPYWRAWAGVIRSGAMVDEGHVAEGFEQLRQGIADYAATGAALARALNLSLLAAAQCKSGEIDDATASLDEALVLVEQTQVRVWEAELYRLEGEVLLESGTRKQGGRGADHGSNAARAERCLLRGIETARSQEAKMCELRAVMSLCRLWKKGSKRAAAHRMLAETYGWFSEGFETEDLRTAQGLLAAG